MINMKYRKNEQADTFFESLSTSKKKGFSHLKNVASAGSPRGPRRRS